MTPGPLPPPPGPLSNPSSAADAEGEGDEQAGKGSFVSRTVVAGNETDAGAGAAQCMGDVSIGCAAELAARPWARPPRNPSRPSELSTLSRQQQRRRQAASTSHSAGSFPGSTDPDTGTAETGQQTDSATNCNCSASTSSKGDSASDSDCGGVDDGQGSGDVTAGKAISESSSWQEELGRQQYDAWELVGLRHCEVARNGAGMFADGGAAVRLLAGGASAELLAQEHLHPQLLRWI